MNLEPMKLNVKKYIYVGCIPVYASPEHPKDQSPCVQIDCPHCHRPMWFSQKKKILEESLRDKVRVYCLECLAIGAFNQRMEPELFDIGKL